VNAYNESGIRKGRLPLIVDALEKISNKVTFEAVINEHVKKYLKRVGYIQDPRPNYESNMIKCKK